MHAVLMHRLTGLVLPTHGVCEDSDGRKCDGCENNCHIFPGFDRGRLVVVCKVGLARNFNDLMIDPCTPAC